MATQDLLLLVEELEGVSNIIGSEKETRNAITVPQLRLHTLSWAGRVKWGEEILLWSNPIPNSNVKPCIRSTNGQFGGRCRNHD